MTEISPLSELEEEPTAAVIEEKEEVEEKQEDEKAKARKRLSDQLKDRTYKWRQSERELEEKNRIIAEYQAKSTIKHEPDPDDYADRDRYNEDREAWKAQERAKIRAEESENFKRELTRAEQQKEIEKQKADYISARQSILKEDSKLHEYEEEIDRVVEAFNAPEIQDLILAAKKQGPKIAQYLGTHPELLEEIASKSPQKRIYEMGRLTAKLEATPVKKISSAPDPVRSEKGSAFSRRVQPTASKHILKKNETWAERTRRLNGIK